MSIQAVAWVLEESTAELGARLVLISIANHAYSDGTGSYPSYATIAREARMSRRNAIEAVKRLEKDGHIRIHRGVARGGANQYVMLGIRKSSGDAGGDVSSLVADGGGDAGGDVEDKKLVMLASPEPSFNHKPRNASRKPQELRPGTEEYRTYIESLADLPPILHFPASATMMKRSDKARESR